MARPLVWIAGDIDQPDLAPAVQWLGEVAETAMVSLASEQRPASGPPAASVLFQARPGRFSQEQVERLHRRAPLARLLAMVGPWCEGEPRSGRPWEGVTRIYWHQWQARLPQELGLTASPEKASIPRQRTMTETENLLNTLRPKPHSAASRGLIAIRTPRRESFSALADACAAAGFRSAWQPPTGPPSCVGADLQILDGWDGASCAKEPPTVLLLDWPRPADLDRAAAHGIRRVLAKPLLLSDLWTTLDSMRGR